jgi:regulator of RNase E activity RraA
VGRQHDRHHGGPWRREHGGARSLPRRQRRAETAVPAVQHRPLHRTGKDRVRLAAVGEPLAINDVRVEPDDLLCGDPDGVLVVPGGRAREGLEIAEQIEATESRIVDAVRQGSTPRLARADLGYHELQTRRRTPAMTREKRAR